MMETEVEQGSNSAGGSDKGEGQCAKSPGRRTISIPVKHLEDGRTITAEEVYSNVYMRLFGGKKPALLGFDTSRDRVGRGAFRHWLRLIVKCAFFDMCRVPKIILKDLKGHAIYQRDKPGAGDVCLDFSALSPCRSIRIKDPVALREERFVVIKGPGIIRVNMEAFLADEEGEVIGPGRKENPAMVFLWDNVTLVNTTKKKLEDANVFYVVGDSCYLNFPNVSKKEIFNWDYAVTSNFGFSYAGYHDKKDMASLIRSMNKRLERNIPEKGMMVSAREFFSDGPDMTIRHYIAKNEIMREVLGMPRA